VVAQVEKTAAKSTELKILQPDVNVGQRFLRTEAENIFGRLNPLRFSRARRAGSGPPLVQFLCLDRPAS
jgi:hypothetical protein